MAPRGEDPIRRIAEALADGRPVDWIAAHAAHPSYISLLNRLRLIERIAALHREMAGPNPRIAHANSNSETPENDQ
jgi:hypothetical protein